MGVVVTKRRVVLNNAVQTDNFTGPALLHNLSLCERSAEVDYRQSSDASGKTRGYSSGDADTRKIKVPRVSTCN